MIQKEIADKLYTNFLNMRIFEDENGKNKSCPKRCVRRIAYDFPSSPCMPTAKKRETVHLYRRRQTGDGRADV